MLLNYEQRVNFSSSNLRYTTLNSDPSSTVTRSETSKPCDIPEHEAMATPVKAEGFEYVLTESERQQMDSEGANYVLMADKIINVIGVRKEDDLDFYEDIKVKLEHIVTLLNLHDPSKAVKLLLKNEELFKKEFDFLSVLRFLSDNGAKMKHLFGIFRFKGIADYTVNNLNNLFEFLRSHGFQQKNIMDIFSKNPELCVANLKDMEVRMNDLKELFKTKDTLKIVSTSPRVLKMPWSRIQEVFDFVYNDMKMSQRQMMNANLFSHSLNKIQTR